MIYVSASKYLWSDAVFSSCYLINRMSSSILNKSSLFSCLHANKTPFSVIPRVFGCTCFVQDLSSGLDKISPRSVKCVFIGYYRTQKRYRCYNPFTRKYLVSAYVTFFDYVIYFSTQVFLTIFETVPSSLSVSLPTPASTIVSLVPPAEITNLPASKPVRDFRYVYTYRPKVLASELIPTNPSSVNSPPPPPLASFLS